MSLPSRAAINTAVNNLHAAFTENRTEPEARYAHGLLNKMANRLKKMYTDRILTIPAITVTDAADADLGVFFVTTGELRVALGADAAIGDIFEVAGTGDTTDNALEGAKGSAAAAGDQFQVTNITGASEAVAYLGADGDFDFTDEDDFDL